jgi:signal transduction histidine kinase
VSAQWSLAAEHDVLAPVLAGSSALESVGALLALHDDDGTLRHCGSLTNQPHLEPVFESFDPAALEFMTSADDTGEPVWLHTADTHQLSLSLAPEHAGVAAWAAVPLQSGSSTIGVLAAAFARPLDFDHSERALVLTLARLAALALTSSLPRAGADVAVASDVAHEGALLARDLHDGVVQDVIASAMNLATLVPLVNDTVRPRLELLIENHDVIVRELRRTIFSLRATDTPHLTPSAELLAWVGASESMLGFPPTAHFSGSVDHLDPVTLGHLKFAIHESLSNVARHAMAGHVDVSVSVGATAVTLMVADDGIGTSPHVYRGNGLDNLANRAHQLGGRCNVSTGSRGGTTVFWSVPLPSTPHTSLASEKESE